MTAATPDLRSFLFTDIEGSSLLWLDHRATMQEAVAAHDSVMREAASRHGGEVFKTAGDAFFVSFRRPSEAAMAACEAQVALAAQAWPEIGPLKVRAAIHVGTAEQRGGDYFGPALNRCARLLALAHGGQVLVTASVAELLASEREVRAPLRRLGDYPLDDPGQMVGICQIVIDGLPQDFPPLRSSPPARREVESDNLPKRLPSLVGREADLEALEALLARADLVTLTGPGGVGKTRLAVEVAKHTVGQYEEGVWLIELAPVTEGAQVPAAVARAMAIELPAGRDPLEALIDRLRLRRCLIVLDNCEHVIDAAAAFAEAILEASSGIKLLASSQEPLGVEGEQVYRLRSLAEVDAATLFAERACSAEAGFAVRPQDEAAVAAICTRLDGIPLAIEMAAARAPSLGVEGVLERLDDRFRLLTGGRRTALPRQRTLAATLDWSHGLLSERDAAVFRRLGGFSGGFTLEAASKVACGEDLDALDVVDAISSLVAKSLVATDPGAERPRYRLLETTRAYALEKLDAAGETHDIQRRHAEWCARVHTHRPGRLRRACLGRSFRGALFWRERQPGASPRLVLWA